MLETRNRSRVWIRVENSLKNSALSSDDRVFPCYWVLFCPVSRALIIKKTKTVLEKRERGVEALEHAKFLVTLS